MRRGGDLGEGGWCLGRIVRFQRGVCIEILPVGRVIFSGIGMMFIFQNPTCQR